MECFRIPGNAGRMHCSSVLGELQGPVEASGSLHRNDRLLEGVQGELGNCWVPLLLRCVGAILLG